MVTMSKDNSNNNALSVNKPKFMKSSKGQRYQRSFFLYTLKKSSLITCGLQLLFSQLISLGCNLKHNESKIETNFQKFSTIKTHLLIYTLHISYNNLNIFFFLFSF